MNGAASYTPVRRMRSAADEGAVREAAERLLAAETPLIWAGQGVLYAEASAELREVAELLGAPAMTTLQGKSAIPEMHPLAAGVGALPTTAMAAHYLQASDCVLAVGSSLTRAPFTPAIPAGKTIVHATNDPIDINKEYAAALGIVADAKLFLAQLAAELRRHVGEGRAEQRAETAETIARIKREWRAEYEPLFADDTAPINGYRMMRELWALLDPETSMLTHESGASRDIQSVFYEAGPPRSYLGWGQSSQLGFSLGLAMGAQARQPGQAGGERHGRRLGGHDRHGLGDRVPQRHPHPHRGQARFHLLGLRPQHPGKHRRATGRTGSRATTPPSRRASVAMPRR